MNKKILDYTISVLIILGIIDVIFLIYIISFCGNNSQPIYIEKEIIENTFEYQPEPLTIEEIASPFVEYINKLNGIDEIKNYSNLDWFIAYKQLNEEYADIGEIENIYDVYSEEDIYYLQRMVETECYGSDFDSKTHVAAVALSRLENEKFPNTLKEIITSPNQFCYGRTEIDQETILACEYAYMIGTEVDGCLYFHSGQLTKNFNGGEYVYSDDAVHHFYK